MLHQVLRPDLPQADQEWFLTEQGEGAVVQVFLSSVSLKKVLAAVRYHFREVLVVYRVKTKDQTDIRNRCVSET